MFYVKALVDCFDNTKKGREVQMGLQVSTKSFLLTVVAQHPNDDYHLGHSFGTDRW